MARMAAYWRILAAVGSGLLLAFSFPPFESSQVAWTALIPLLLALLHRNARDADSRPGTLCRERIRGESLTSQPEHGNSFRLGFTAGLVFWLVTMSWMLRLLETSPAPALLIVLGWGLLSAYCALYFGIFAMTVTWVAGKIGQEKLWQTAVLTVLIPILWVGGEMARSILFTGFPWDLLGISQYRNIVLIQCAQWVGVPGVSALVMLANTGLAFTMLRYLPPREAQGYRPHIELFMALMTIAVCFRMGLGLIRQECPPRVTVEIAAVQPAIPQVKKWSQEQVDLIHATFRRLVRQATAKGETRPDLMIWPETATPYSVTEEGESRDLVSELSRNGSPILVGAIDIINLGHEQLCYNGSFLFDTNGVMVKQYNKRHLVPFGEYIPLNEWVPWLARLAPMGLNCTPGHEVTVFALGQPAWPFSVLICFEDIMAGLSRDFVKAGARLLINQTNDAWFDRSAGPLQHLSHCVFRCVENRVPAVRVANSGISCLIQPNGFIVDPTENTSDSPPLALTPRWPVAIPGGEFKPTVYTRYGDWLFGIPCGIVAAVCFVLALLGVRRKDNAE